MHYRRLARATSEVVFDWSSKSTLLAVLARLMVAPVAVILFGKQRDPESVDGFGRRFLALVAAVIAGRLPAAIVIGWSGIKIYPSRVLLPILAFASCASVAVVLVVTRSKYRRFALSGFVFLAAYQLVVRAFEQRTISQALGTVELGQGCAGTLRLWLRYALNAGLPEPRRRRVPLPGPAIGSPTVAPSRSWGQAGFGALCEEDKGYSLCSRLAANRRRRLAPCGR